MMTDGCLVAIGDIHGDAAALHDLLRRLAARGLHPGRDTVIFLGDLIDRGPASREVVETVMALAAAHPHWVVLQGNHEEQMLTAGTDPATWAVWSAQGGVETLRSYDPDPPFRYGPGDIARLIPAAHREWLAARPSIHETASFIFVHAGLDPRLPLAANPERTLRWIRQEFIASPRDWGKRVIFGHTRQRAPLLLPNKIGIDTLLSGGCLTAAILRDDAPHAVEFVTAPAG